MPTRLSALVRPLAAAALAAAAAACNELPVAPTEPVPEPTTVVVTGTVARNGAFTHAFYTNTFGNVHVTLVSLDPNGETAIGLALGEWSGVACQLRLVNDRAMPGTTITGSIGAPAGLCVRVYDPGTLAGATAFEVQIVHP